MFGGDLFCEDSPTDRRHLPPNLARLERYTIPPGDYILHVRGGQLIADELEIDAELQGVMVLVHEFRAPLIAPQGKGLGTIMFRTPPLHRHSTKRFNAFLVTNPSTGRSALSGVSVPFRVDEPVEELGDTAGSLSATDGCASVVLEATSSLFTGPAPHAFRRVFVVEFLDSRGESCVWCELPVDLVGERVRPLRCLPMQPELSLADFNWQMLRNATVELEIARKEVPVDRKSIIHAKVDSHHMPSIPAHAVRPQPRRPPRTLKDGVTLAQCFAGPTAIPHKPVTGTSSTATSASRRRGSHGHDFIPVADDSVDSPPSTVEAVPAPQSPQKHPKEIEAIYSNPVPRTGIGRTERPRVQSDLPERPPFVLRWVPEKPAAGRRHRARRHVKETPAPPQDKQKLQHVDTQREPSEPPGADTLSQIQQKSEASAEGENEASAEGENELVGDNALATSTHPQSDHPDKQEEPEHQQEQDLEPLPLDESADVVCSRQNSLPRLRREDSTRTRTARDRALDGRTSVTSLMSIGQLMDGDENPTPQRQESFGKGASSVPPVRRSSTDASSLITSRLSIRHEPLKPSHHLSPLAATKVDAAADLEGLTAQAAHSEASTPHEMIDDDDEAAAGADSAHDIARLAVKNALAFREQEHRRAAQDV